jgi:hypothetical protein
MLESRSHQLPLEEGKLQQKANFQAEADARIEAKYMNFCSNKQKCMSGARTLRIYAKSKLYH